ncbi:MAG: DUF4112 domain-containing protein [Bacteroidales bacterium]|nr:DUF4112 domain-containing protein [Bacteroidales bacterium]
MATELRQQLEHSTSYPLVRNMAKFMDDYYIDPVVGLALPMGIGDMLTQTLALPYLYISMMKIGSWKLTLAIVYNILVDILLGSIPFFIGDVIDMFNKYYKRNFKLIEGYIDQDQYVINEVENNAYRVIAMIVILILLIVLLWTLVSSLIGGVFSIFG